METSSANMASIQETKPAINSPKGSASTPSPFIKRKCLSKELGIKENTGGASSNNSSPFVIQTIKMDSTSPKLLNDSFETVKHGQQFENGSGSRRTAHYLSRRATFSKHKSAPLSRLAFGELFSSACESASNAHAYALASIKSSPLSISANILPPLLHPPTGQPLNNIINQIHVRTSNNPNTANLKMTDDNSFSEEHQDHITDLENLIFGGQGSQQTAFNTFKTISSNGTNNAQLQDHQHFIKQSLDNDAAGKNLIGDKTREHILPVKAGAKHSDLHCIDPDRKSVV